MKGTTNLSDAARIIGVNHRAVRNWLDRGHLHLGDSAHVARKWRALELRDLINTTCIARLTRFGLTPGEAAAIVDRHIAPRAARATRKLNDRAARKLFGCVIRVTRNDDDGSVSATALKPEAAARELATGGPAGASPGVALYMDLGRLVARLTARLIAFEEREAAARDAAKPAADDNGSRLAGDS